MKATAQLVELVARSLRHAGWAGAAGMGLIVLAVLIGVLGGNALEARRTALAGERAGLLAAPASPTVPGGAPGLRAAVFIAGLPGAGDLPALLTKVHAHADLRGLVIERTEYRLLDDATQPIQRVLVSLPVQGDFAALSGWLGDLLADMPELALESFTVRRGDTAQMVLEGEVRLQLHLRRLP